MDLEKKKVDAAECDGTGKVILVYSGGVDTSAIVGLIKQICDADAITLSVDLGQKKYKRGDLDMSEETILHGVKKVFFIKLCGLDSSGGNNATDYSRIDEELDK